MAASSSTAGIALLLVSVLGIAAVGGVVSYDYHDVDNPNGILGVYTVAEYTQGGIGPDGEWHWYETGDGTYDGETIILEKYEKGFVKGTIHLFGQKYLLNGFYDPESCSFGYASYYNYTPGSNDGVVDILYGSIYRDVMILTGYTVSAQNATQAFAFSFIFVKNGAPYYNYFADWDLNFGSFITNNAIEYNTNGEKKSITGDFTYAEKEYRNGVYKIEMADGKYAAAVSVGYNSDYDETALRCIHIVDGTICTEWVILNNDHLYAFACDSWDTSKTTFIAIRTSPTHLTYPMNEFFSNVTTQSSSNWKVSGYQNKLVPVFHDDTASSFVLKSSIINNEKFIVNEWDTIHDEAQTNHQVSAMLHFSIGCVDYYGEMIGYYSNGSLHMFGFLVSSEGETLAIHEVRDVTA